MRIELHPDGEPGTPALPALMRNKVNNMVIWFLTRDTGVIIDPSRTSHPAGKFDEGWIDYDDDRTWEPFKGTVTIRNE